MYYTSFKRGVIKLIKLKLALRDPFFNMLSLSFKNISNANSFSTETPKKEFK